ncbi:MAG: TraB/GumN family protein [Bacteroides sp.]
MADVYKLKQLGLSLLFLWCILTPSQAQLLWKISGNNCKESYVFGTHHLIPSNQAQSVKGLEEAFNKSTLIVGELSIEELLDPTAITYMSQAMVAPSDSLLSSLLAEEDLQIIRDLDEAYPNEQMPLLPIMDYFTPTAISTIISNNLTQSVMRKLFPDETSEAGIDLIFQEKAREDKKQIRGLESLQFQADLLYKSGSILESAKELRETLSCLQRHLDFALAEIELLTQNYLEQDLAGMYEQAMSSDTRCSVMQVKEEDWTRLVDRRNLSWIPLIESFIADTPTFIAVGALHLPGKQGLIELLRQKGYTVEPASL